MVQAVWSTAHGRPFAVTDGVTGEQVTRLAGHFDPALALFVPFWWIHPHPETMIVLQAAALAAGIYPVVRLAMKYVGSPVAAGLLAAWYLVFPWLVWNAVNDVHAVTLAIPLLLYGIWFLDEHRLGRFAVVAVLAMLTGELIGLTVAALGVWYAIRSRRARIGLGIAVLGTAWTAICLFLLIPATNDGEPSPYYDRFESVGGSPGGLVTTLFTDPLAIVDAVTTQSDGAYLLRVLMPTAFLALGSPLLLIAALPQLGVNLLTDWWPSTQPQYQYVAALVPVLVASTIMPLRRFSPTGRLAMSAVLVGASVLCLAIWRPVPGGHFYIFSAREPGERVAAMRAALRLVPADAPVTATNRLGARLGP